MTKKYELTAVSRLYNGSPVYQIRALEDIPEKLVKEGDIGGWVSSEKNLSHKGTAWIYHGCTVCEDAMVYGDARVGSYEGTCSAIVSAQARVFDNAWVFGAAKVLGNANIHGRAEVCDNAVVMQDARVCENAFVDAMATVSGKATICGTAMVSSNATILGSAVIDGGTIIRGRATITDATIIGAITITGNTHINASIRITGATSGTISGLNRAPVIIGPIA